MTKTKILQLFPVMVLLAAWQQATAQPMLEVFIKRGLNSNLILMQKTFVPEKAKLNLEWAKSLFYPLMGPSVQYTLANEQAKGPLAIY